MFIPYPNLPIYMVYSTWKDVMYVARPRKDESQKSKKISITIKPDVLPHLEAFCKKENLTTSWVIDKALREWLPKNGEDI